MKPEPKVEPKPTSGETTDISIQQKYQGIIDRFKNVTYTNYPRKETLEDIGAPELVKYGAGIFKGEEISGVQIAQAAQKALDAVNKKAAKNESIINESTYNRWQKLIKG